MSVLAERGLQLQQYIRQPREQGRGPLVTREFISEVDGYQSSEDRRTQFERPQEGAGTEAWISYFDSNWQKEGLPRDWYNLRSRQNQKKVGFMMKRQMDALKDPSKREEVLDWAKKTRRDLQGFKLEFLSDHIVYPRKYQIITTGKPDEPYRIEDPMYGKSKDSRYTYADIEEVVSEEERKGSVKWAMREIKSFLSTAPEGSMTVLTSPLGPTGLKTDMGEKGEIEYEDTYFFVGVKISPTEIMNYTIKTDFTLKDARAVISQLTGTELPQDASLEEYAYTLAKIKPGERGIKNIFDIVDILKKVHPDAPFVEKQSRKITDWKEVYDDIVHGEDLYNFDKETTAIIDDFSTYAEAEVVRSKLDHQKGISATILNMAKHFFTTEQTDQHKKHRKMTPQQWYRLVPGGGGNFGSILTQTTLRLGCSGGGGSATVSTAGGERNGSINKGSEEGFSCSECSFKALAGNPVGDTCPGCGFTKQQYAEKYGVACD